MNPSTTSDCSSGCESGWTVYLDELSDSTHNSLHNNMINMDNYFSRNNYYQEEEEAAENYEDLSMVSDASSGPPQICYNPVCAEITKKENERRKRVQKDYKKQQHKNLCLDDTASSVPVFRFSHQDNAAGFSHGFSDDDHDYIDQAELKAKKKFGFFKSAANGKSGGFMGRKRQ